MADVTTHSGLGRGRGSTSSSPSGKARVAVSVRVDADLLDIARGTGHLSTDELRRIVEGALRDWLARQTIER